MYIQYFFKMRVSQVTIFQLLMQSRYNQLFIPFMTE